MLNSVKDSLVLPLTNNIVDKAIEIRRSRKIKLPDAIIAATALAHDYTLISRNDDDFRKIPGLKYINPFTDIYLCPNSPSSFIAENKKTKAKSLDFGNCG
jgi:predicted nucleic acid-binding protein